jgi:hypothetical protein
LGPEPGAPRVCVAIGIAYFVVTPSTPSSSTVAGTIAKQGYLALGNNDNVLFPSIGVNAAGKGVMTFSISGHHYFPSTGYTSIDAASGAGPIHGQHTRPTFKRGPPWAAPSWTGGHSRDEPSFRHTQPK